MGLSKRRITQAPSTTRFSVTANRATFFYFRVVFVDVIQNECPDVDVVKSGKINKFKLMLNN